LVGIRWKMPVISFIFLNIFLLFTLLDLHQPLRMINIFLHPHWTSAITVGAWMASLFTGIITIMALIGFLDAHPDVRRHCPLAKTCRKMSPFYEKVLPFTVFLAIPVTLYTAVIMGEASARELWQTPTELAQMLLAALMVGSATLILISGNWSDRAKKELALILAISVFLSFLMYMGEYFLSFKSAEAEATLEYVHRGGEYSVEFWLGMALGYIIPFFIAIDNLKENSSSMMKFASLMALIGLYLAKDVWLKIPQMLPLS
jgi:formate-dependent nitrite reductase membrane component NrfD